MYVYVRVRMRVGLLVGMLLVATLGINRFRGERGDPGTQVPVCLAADPLANGYPLAVYDGTVRYYWLACIAIQFECVFLLVRSCYI